MNISQLACPLPLILPPNLCVFPYSGDLLPRLPGSERLFGGITHFTEELICYSLLMWELLKGEGIPQFLAAVFITVIITLAFQRLRKRKSGASKT